MPKVTNHLNLGQKQLQNALIHKLASNPSSPVAGQIYYNTGDNSTYVYNGTAWEKLNNVAMSDADILTAVKNVDGSGSGLDADLLDGQHGSYYMPATTKLNSITAPDGAVSLNSQNITNLADPQNAQDAATKAYVDAVAQGLDPKQSVKVATTSNVADRSGEQTIDGVSLTVGSRVLLAGQTTPSQNGIYIVGAGAWAIAPDADETSGKLTKGAFTFAENNGKGYVYLGSNSWTQFSEATTISAGTGISVSTSGTTSTVSLNTNLGSGVYVARGQSFLIGNGTDTSFTLSSFGSDDKVVSVRENGGNGEYVLADVVHVNSIETTITFADAPSNNQYRVTIIGF